MFLNAMQSVLFGCDTSGLGSLCATGSGSEGGDSQSGGSDTGGGNNQGGGGSTIPGEGD